MHIHYYYCLIFYHLKSLRAYELNNVRHANFRENWEKIVGVRADNQYWWCFYYQPAVWLYKIVYPLWTKSGSFIFPILPQILLQVKNFVEALPGYPSLFNPIPRWCLCYIGFYEVWKLELVDLLGPFCSLTLIWNSLKGIGD